MRRCKLLFHVETGTADCVAATRAGRSRIHASAIGVPVRSECSPVCAGNSASDLRHHLLPPTADRTYSAQRGLLFSLLLACLYTEPFAYLPAAGYLLLLLAFIVRADKRRAFWYALPSTVVPLLLFLPYFFWSQPFANPRWLFDHDHVLFSDTIYLDVMHALGGGGATAYVLSAILIVAAAIACWRSFQLTDAAFSKRVALLCLFGAC